MLAACTTSSGSNGTGGGEGAASGIGGATTSSGKANGGSGTVSTGMSGATTASGASVGSSSGGAGTGGSDSGGGPSGGSTQGGSDGGPAPGGQGGDPGDANADTGGMSGLEPYRRCDMSLGEEDNWGCDPGATCLNGVCDFSCTVDPNDITGPGDECPRPLTGDPDIRCVFGHCTLHCPSGPVCPDGMQCLDPHYTLCVYPSDR